MNEEDSTGLRTKDARFPQGDTTVVRILTTFAKGRSHTRTISLLKIRFVAAAFLLVLPALAPPTRANAAIDPAKTCEVSKLNASANYAKCIFKVDAKAIAQQKMGHYGICERRFADHWAKIEAKGGGACPTQGDNESIDTAISDAAGDARTLTNSPPEMVRCAAAQENPLGTYLKCLLDAYAKAINTGKTLATGACVVKLDKAWSTAAKKFPSMCDLTSVQRVRDNLNAQAAEIARLLSSAPPPPTPPPPACGDNRLNQPTEECDGKDAHTCPGTCRADCTCPNQAARVKLDIDLVQIGGRPGHEGSVPTAREPIAGKTARVLASVLGPSDTAEFRIVDSTNHFIQNINLTGKQFTPGIREYAGDVAVPVQPFKIAASGTTRDGSAYDVVGERLFTPQPVALILDPFSGGRLSPGGTITPRFRLVNYGPADTFNFTASDNLGILRYMITPSSAMLGTGEAMDITVEVSAGSDLRQGIVPKVTFTATSASNASITNSFTARVMLE